MIILPVWANTMTDILMWWLTGVNTILNVAFVISLLCTSNPTSTAYNTLYWLGLK